MMLFRVVLGVIDAHDDGGIWLFGRGGDNDFAGACGEVLGCVFVVPEQAGALHGDIDAQLLPGKLRRVFDGGVGNFFIVDDDGILFGADGQDRAARARSRMPANGPLWEHR
jgi:hypothetical protein